MFVIAVYFSEESQNLFKLGRLKIQEENIFSMKIRANDIDLTDAEHFDSFSSVIFNCKIKYCRFDKKLNNINLN